MGERIAIIGGGIGGVAIARALVLRGLGEVTVFEKEQRLAAHQTGHNSGVVHAGLYYQPGTLKAQLCAAGRIAIRDYCAEKNLPYREVGKLVVAVDEGELPALAEIHRRARTNGVPDLVRLDGGDRLREIEPAVAGIGAVHSPHTAAVDYGAITEAMAADVRGGGGTVLTGHEIVGLQIYTEGVRVRAAVADPAGDIVADRAGARATDRADDRAADRAAHRAGDRAADRADDRATDRAADRAAHRAGDRAADMAFDQVFDRVIVCAGLQSDVVARLVGADPSPKILPFRGEYWALDAARTDLVRGMIYPVPDPRFPFLGVHFTRGVYDDVHVGPNAVPALAREGYSWLTLSPKDTWESLRWPGAAALARQHWRMGIDEIGGSLVKPRYYRKARRFIPELRMSDLTHKTAAGVRAQAWGRDGTLLDDFTVDQVGPVTLLRNAPSPAATSSMAIADHLIEHYVLARTPE